MKSFIRLLIIPIRNQLQAINPVHQAVKYWVVIPAAGIGSRMEADIPKQYISIYGKTVIEHTLDCFLQRDDIYAVVVAISKNDTQWNKLPLSRDSRVIKAEGGKERYHSVTNALNVIAGQNAHDDDWVMVHDAVRPCLSQSAINRLIAELDGNDVGGILALPCRDTMKRGNDSAEIVDTVEREQLWHAQTPQMFRFKKLYSALKKIEHDVTRITDEAMAIEFSGFRAKLILGHQENMKLTHKDDIKHAEIYLK